jgi:hypothetical protein
VPDVPLLEDMADRGKVTDLQNDVVAEFGERLGCCGMGMGHDFFEVEKAETSFEKGQTEWRDLFDIQLDHDCQLKHPWIWFFLDCFGMKPCFKSWKLR